MLTTPHGSLFMFSRELKRLRDWFIKNAAELPWRPSDVCDFRDPYAVWISETMLQQTQVSTVKDYFTRWMKRFPNVKTLAAAEEEEVFKYWQGLGYYSRARNILKTARIVTENCAGVMPATRKELEALPGIGAYTAGAILSLAYHKPEAILDGNLVRVFSRLYLLDFLPTDSRDSNETYWNYAREVSDHPKGFLHNEALMELGRTTCKVKSPECENCHLRSECKAHAEGLTPSFPPSKKHLQKDWHGTVLVIESADNKILTVHGGQKFFNNQFALPHYESPRNATVGVPAEMACYGITESAELVEDCGSFKHSITVHKMDCQVLYIKLAGPSCEPHIKNKMEIRWIEKASATEALANSFSLKALKLAKVIP